MNSATVMGPPPMRILRAQNTATTVHWAIWRVAFESMTWSCCSARKGAREARHLCCRWRPRSVRGSLAAEGPASSRRGALRRPDRSTDTMVSSETPDRSASREETNREEQWPAVPVRDEHGTDSLAVKGGELTSSVLRQEGPASSLSSRAVAMHRSKPSPDRHTRGDATAAESGAELRAISHACAEHRRAHIVTSAYGRVSRRGRACRGHETTMWAEGTRRSGAQRLAQSADWHERAPQLLSQLSSASRTRAICQS